MYTDSLLPGDRLLVMKDAVIDITHSGTYMGGDLVAHISPMKGLVMERLEAFANYQKVQVIKNGGIPERLLHERFKQFQADPSYRLFGNNCEHLCNFLEIGKTASPQLQGLVTGFTGGLIASQALRIENPWATLLLVAFTSYVGAKLGHPSLNKVN